MNLIRIAVILSAMMLLGLLYLIFAGQHWPDEVAVKSPPDPGLPDAGWPVWGGDEGGSRYADASQITPENIDQLKPVWTFRTGETGEHYGLEKQHTFQATPVLIGNTLYFSTAFNRVFALDAETGERRWMFDAGLDLSHPYSEMSNRGVGYWSDPQAGQRPCRERIFVGTLDARLIALDALTGQRCSQFADGGEADLMAAVPAADRGTAYPVTSPPVVIGDTVVLGSGMIDNEKVNLGLGTVWAFDARSGVLRWLWHAIPRDPEAPHARDWQPDQAARTGTANVWAPLSVDTQRGLIYAATGSASPDYYGGERLGDNRWANSLVCLRAENGELVWGRQLVHHDLWDYDLPAQPVLVDLEKDGVTVPAVIQATKMGLLFSFNRETGEPVFPIEERPVPASDVPGEQASPTQPFPAAPPPLVPHKAITEDDAFGVAFFDQQACRKLLSRYRSEGLYTPPSIRGSILVPGNVGGSNWGGIAFDKRRRWVIANTSHLPFIAALIPADRYQAVRDSGQFPGDEFAPQTGTPYGLRRGVPRSFLGAPCFKPPWGKLAAVDMVKGEIRWEVPFGTTAGQTPFPIEFNWGLPNIGGPIITVSGLIFIGAAMDNFLRAYDIESGRELWRGRLPAGGQANPMTYQLNGRQYVVIAVGGHGRMQTKRGDYVIAFALASGKKRSERAMM